MKLKGYTIWYIEVVTVPMQQQGDDRPLPRTGSRTLIVFSEVVSILLHPLFMTTLSGIVVSDFVHWRDNSWIGTVVACTIVLPFLAILLFRITGVISNVRMDKPRDRVLPLVATLIFYFVAYKIFVSQYQPPQTMQSLLLGSCLSVLIILVINFFYKVSVHTTAAAVLMAAALTLAIRGEKTTMLLFAFAVVLAALVGVVRWFLGAHTLGQISLGYAVAIFSQIITCLLLTHNTFLARILLLS